VAGPAVHGRSRRAQRQSDRRAGECPSTAGGAAGRSTPSSSWP